jgi:hypothetical protein
MVVFARECLFHRSIAIMVWLIIVTFGFGRMPTGVNQVAHYLSILLRLQEAERLFHATYSRQLLVLGGCG